MTNISISNFVAIGTNLQMLYALETQFECIVFTHGGHNETHHVDIAMNST